MDSLIRKTYRVGNSAGVVVPREWLDGFVEVKLVELPLRKDASHILNILQKERIDTSVILGIAITGSHARRENTSDSDVDILVITDGLNKKIKAGRYEITIISQETLESQLNNMGFPILPMILEAEAIINEKLFCKYKENKLSSKALKWLVDTTESSMKISKEQALILKELGEDKASDNFSYSLILRLRTIYLMKNLLNGTKWHKKDFLKLIKKISGALTVYEGYVRIKKNRKVKKELRIEDAEKLIDYIMESNEELKKWIKNKKSNS